MAGPVPTYLATQMAAQTAFTVPFGLLAFVNAAIATATAAGEFNVTVDCSLFVTEDVSNLRIYLDSLGYDVEFAKGLNEKGLNIDWGRFRDVPGTAVTVYQGTTPWIVAGTVAATQSGPWTVSLTSGSIEIGTVDQGTAGTDPWLVDVTNTVNVAVTNFPAVQPVSGTVTALQGTSPWVVSGSITTSPDVNVHDGAGNPISSTGTSLDVNVTDFPATVAVTQSTSPWVVSGSVSVSNFPAVQPVSGTVTANQGTSPWTIAGTVTANAGTGTFLVDGSAHTQPVSGTITANQGTSPWIVSGTIITSPDVNVHDGSGNSISSTAGSLNVDVTNIVSVTGPLTDTQLRATPVPVSGTIAVTQSTTPWTIAGTVTANAGTGNFTVVQSSGANLHVDVDNFPATQPISGTVTADQGTSPWVIAGTVTANIGTTGGLLLDSTFTARVNVLGQKTMANSTPVVLASDQSAIPVTQSGAWTTGRTWTLSSGTDSVAAVQSGTWTVQQGTPPWSVSQSGTWNINNISGTISLPTGAATEATLLAAKVDLDKFTFSATRLLVDGSGTVQPISGTVTANQGTSPWVVSGSGNFTVVQPTGTNLHTVLDSGTLTSITNALPAGTNLIGHVIADSGSTTVVTGNVTVVQPTGTNLHTVLDSGTLTSITNALPAGTNVIGHVIADSGSTTAVTGNVTVVQPTGTNLHTVVDSGTIAATQSGTWTTGRTWTLASGTDSVAAVQSGTWTVQPGNTPNTSPWLIEQRAPGISTYSASVLGLTTAATPTDIFTIYGSGSKTIKILRIEISATENTAAVRDIVLIKRSATNTGGTSTAATAVPHDSNNAAATATVLSYTANPAALGASVGNVRTAKADIPATNLVGNTDRLVWDFATRPGQAIVLRGTNQGLTINLNSVTSASNSFDIDVEWTEE